MTPLSPHYRKQLERIVGTARQVAEAGAIAALEALAVNIASPYPHMGDLQRHLRRRLRAHARQLGDRAESGAQTIERLVQECGYEHVHGMLFARFLAENDLLIEPEMGVAVTLDECEELAKEQAPATRHGNRSRRCRAVAAGDAGHIDLAAFVLAAAQ